MVMGPPSPVRNPKFKGLEQDQTVDGVSALSDGSNGALDPGRSRLRVKLVKHKEAQLEFLDFYDEKSYGEMMLRRRKAVPEEHLHREDPTINYHPREGYMMGETSTYSDQSKRRAASEAVSLDASRSFLGPNFDSHTFKGQERTKLRDMHKADINTIEYVTLIRPARTIKARFEKPFTKKRFFDIANDLYPPLPTTSSKQPASSTFMLVPFQGNGSFEVVARLSDEPSNRNDAEIVWKNFVADVLPRSRQGFLIIKEFESIRVQAGGNQALAQLWDPKGIYSSDLDEFNATVQGLLNIFTNFFGIYSDSEAIRLQVDRYKTEWLDLLPLMDQDDAKREVFWKIDDPIINAYGEEQFMSENFVQSEMQRTKQLKEGEHQRGTQILLSDEVYSDPIHGQAEGHRARTTERLRPASIYGDNRGAVSLPRFGPSEEPHLTAGHDMPQIYGQQLTQENLITQRRRLQAVENDILEREHICRVCEIQFLSQDVHKIREHYRSHRASAQLCPYCQENWTEKNRQERITHLAINHCDNHTQPRRGSCPFLGCAINLADGTVFVDTTEIAEHLRSHLDDLINDNVCSLAGCWAPLGLFTDNQRVEHGKMHKNSCLTELTSNNTQKAIQPPKKPLGHTEGVFQQPPKPVVCTRPVVQLPQPTGNQKKRKLCSVCSADLTTVGKRRETAHFIKHKGENAQILLMGEDEKAQARANRGFTPKPATPDKKKRKNEETSESEPDPKKRITGVKRAGGNSRQRDQQDDPKETTPRRSMRARTPKK